MRTAAFLGMLGLSGWLGRAFHWCHEPELDLPFPESLFWELLLVCSPSSSAGSEGFLMKTEIHSPTQCEAEKMCSLCIWGQNPLLASKNVTGGFPSSRAELACLYLELF